MSRRNVIVDDRFCFEEETHLTVHKTSVFVPGGDGFIVYDSTGEIVFRVDSYGPESDSKDELVLMDSIVATTSDDPSEEYHSEGSFSNGSCAISIYNTNSSSRSRELVAEIKRKVDPKTKVMLGKDVFLPCIKPWTDGAFVMALVLILDRLCGFDIDDSIANEVPALGVEGVSS